MKRKMASWLRKLPVLLGTAAAAVFIAGVMVLADTPIRVADATTQGSASRLELNKTYYFERGNGARDRISWFRFTTPATEGYLTFYFKNNDGTDYWANYEIRTAMGEKIADGEAGESSTVSAERYVTNGNRAGGAMSTKTTYYVKVWDLLAGSHGQMWFEFHADRNLNEEQYAEQITFNKEYNRSIDAYQYDTDFFKIRPSHSGNVKFIIKNISVDDWLDYSVRYWDTRERIQDTVNKYVEGEVAKNNVAEWTVYLQAGKTYYLSAGEDKRGTYLFSFNNQAVTGITLNKTSVKLAVGEGTALSAIVSPSNAFEKNLGWNSSDDSIVSVNQEGQIRGERPGVAVVTVMAKDGSGVQASCKVSVNPDNPGSLQVVSRKTSSVKLSWNEVYGATGYKVYLYNSSKKKYTSKKTTSSTSATIKKLKAGKTYKFKVVAYTKNSEGTAKSSGTVISTPTAPAKTKITKAAKGSSEKTWDGVINTRKLTWKKVSCKGYHLYASTSGKNGYYEQIQTLKAKKYKSIKVKYQKGTTVYFKVAAFVKDGTEEIEGAMSAPKKVKF